MAESGDVRSAVVTFTKPVTYNKRRQIEAVLGTFPNDTRLLIKQSISNPKLWNVYRPGHSSTAVHGPTTTVAPVLIAVNRTLRQAKQIATERLLSMPVKVSLPPAAAIGADTMAPERDDTVTTDLVWTGARYAEGGKHYGRHTPRSVDDEER